MGFVKSMFYCSPNSKYSGRCIEIKKKKAIAFPFVCNTLLTGLKIKMMMTTVTT